MPDDSPHSLRKDPVGRPSKSSSVSASQAGAIESAFEKVKIAREEACDRVFPDRHAPGIRSACALEIFGDGAWLTDRPFGARFPGMLPSSRYSAGSWAIR